MFRNSILCRLARRVLPCLVAVACVAPLLGTPIADDSESRIDLFDHVRTERDVSISPEG